jgi:1,4-dihydroxy-2-naphthoate octaprenyltransferase
MRSWRSARPTLAGFPAFPSAWRPWVLAARVPTLPAAVAPVLVGTAAAAGTGVFHPAPALAALAGALAIQIGTNYHNDAADFLQGADDARRRGPQRAAASGLLPARRVLSGAYASFAVAAAAGLYLVWLRGWPVAVVGLLSIAAGIAYTAAPLRLGYRGLGEIFVFLFFGVVAVVGSDYVQTGLVRAQAAAASMPVGLLAVAVLVANNLRDIETDRAAGKRTLAVRLGAPATRVLYAACLAGALAAPAAMRAAGFLGDRFWLPWLGAPLAVMLAAAAYRSHDAGVLVRVLKRTAGLLLLYGVLLALALLGGPA